MGNLYLSQILYNEEHKNKFLNEYQVGNKKTNIFYRYIFQRAYKTELQLDKDIYDFNDEELYSLIKSYKNGSHAAASSVVSVLKKYLDYCVSKGFIRVNLLQDISGYNDYMQFVDQVANQQKFISREQFEQMINDCLNYQDAYPLAMAYYGFKGEGNCEIVNLKVSDVNEEEKTIFIANRNESYIVDDYLIDIIINTIKEDEYKKALTDENVVLRSESSKIYANDYVMRIASKNINEPASPINVTSRLNRVKGYAGKQFQYLTITSIWYSGMLDRAKAILAEKGEVSKEDWIEIGNLYGYDAMYWSKNRQRFEPFLKGEEE